MNQTVAIEKLIPARWNPRGDLEDASLAELVASITAQGILVPLLVRAVDGNQFEIVAGHRRHRAAQLAGLAEVPVRVGTYADQEAREVAIVENLQREDIPPLEEARAFRALVDDGASPAAIAPRVGKPERYVWERLRLVHLAPDAAALLAAGTITVQHAIVLARLEPADQARVIEDGLFTHEQALPVVRADGDFEDADGESSQAPWAGMKPVSVRELQRYVAEHVRFNPQQAATASPLDFGPVAEQVMTATAQPGRGHKVIHITRDHYVQPSAKSTERTFTARAWKRADGQEGSATCERSVLGVVVVGPGYGEAFPVCIHRDCDTHWAAERKAAERQKRLTGSRARARDDAEDRKAKERQAREEAARKAWETERGPLLKALGAHVAARKPGLVQALRQRFKWEVDRVAKDYGVTLTSATAGAVVELARIPIRSRVDFASAAKRWKFKVPKGAAKADVAPPATPAANATVRAASKRGAMARVPTKKRSAA